MKKITVAASMLGGIMLFAAGMAHADNACDAEIQKTLTDWRDLHLVSTGKPMSPAKGMNGHSHISAEVDSMRFHMSQAKDLCKAGNDHEALLHLDVVRAFLKIPEIQHPVDHHYLLDEKAN